MKAISRLLFVFLILFQFGFLTTGSEPQVSVNLKNIKRISRACYLIQHEYYDKGRIDPRQMLEEGFFELAKEVPEVLPKFTKTVLYFQLGSLQTQIDLSLVHQFYDILSPVSRAFDFLAEHYKGDKEFADLEYAFITGMLTVLDPHSNLLVPKVYEEFKTQTSGHYGGLGIVIGLQDGDLTVISPIEDTPAYRAGLLAEDRILQIDDQPTINMTLTEAVDLMRGPPHTKVVLKIKSKNRDERFVTLTREVIEIKSVQSKLLKVSGKNIAVIRIKGFQEDTYSDLDMEWQRLLAQSKNQLHGVVLDLRNNPGGILDQAILISDRFLADGAIVYTVGADDVDQEVAMAKPQTDDILLPATVLLNEGSASASEIVAGALSNNDRAAVLGKRSFGKGSVQTLISLRDGSSLKLTVAQYLTPGKHSIQAVGVVPDIHAYPSTVGENFFDLREDQFFSETKLNSHLVNEKHNKSRKSFFDLTYLDKEKKEEENEFVSKIQEEDDPLLSLAAEILAKAGDISKQKTLEEGLPVLKEEMKKQDQVISAALKKKGIDWEHCEEDAAVELAHRYQVTDSSGQVLSVIPADTEVKLTVFLKNSGFHPLCRVIADIDSFNPLINHKELVFGKIDPGAEKAASFSFKIPSEIISFKEDAKLLIYTEKTRDKPLEKFIETQFQEKLPASLAYSYQVFDGNTPDSSGNSNGVPERGEKIALEVTVKNFGPGISEETVVNIKNKEGEHVFLTKARDTIGKLSVGARGKALLTFDVKESFDGEKFEVDFFAVDQRTKSTITDTFRFQKKGDGFEIDPPFQMMQQAPDVEILRASRQEGEEYHFLAEVKSDKAIQDIAIFSNGKKQFYLNLANQADQKKRKVDVKLPLEDGLNSIVIQTRGDRNLISQKNISVVYRKK